MVASKVEGLFFQFLSLGTHKTKRYKNNMDNQNNTPSSEQPRMADAPKNENEDEDSDFESIKTQLHQKTKTKGRVLVNTSSEETESEEEEVCQEPAARHKRRMVASAEGKPPAKKRRTGAASVATKLTLHAAAPNAFNNKKSKKTKAKAKSVKVPTVKTEPVIKTEPVASQEGVVVLERNRYVTGLKEPTLKSDGIECLGCAPVYNTKITTDTKQLRQDINQHTSKKFKAFEAFVNQHASKVTENYLNELPGFLNDTKVMISIMNKKLEDVQNDMFHVASDMRNVKDDMKKVFSWHGNMKADVLGFHRANNRLVAAVEELKYRITSLSNSAFIFG